MEEADFLEAIGIAIAFASTAMIALTLNGRRPLPRIRRVSLVVMLLCLASALSCIHAVDPQTSRVLDREITDEQYERVGEMAFVPVLQPMVAAALADHVVTRREYLDLLAVSSSADWKRLLTEPLATGGTRPDAHGGGETATVPGRQPVVRSPAAPPGAVAPVMPVSPPRPLSSASGGEFF